ncbi:hypothetical protein JCM19000A_30160 [Silvimonas sp. JCM 19000]
MPSPRDSELLAQMTEADLDELSTFLESDLAPIQSMDLSMLHGFLTAQLVGPTELPPERWFGLVWGEHGEQPKWKSAHQREKIEGLILRLYNQLVDELNQDPPSFTPMVYVDQERQLDIVQQWCYGFMLGTSLNAEGWQPLLDDEDNSNLIAPILDCADEEARDAAEAEGEDLAQFEHNIAQALPEVIPAIREYWQQHGDDDGLPEPTKRPGRAQRRH